MSYWDGDVTLALEDGIHLLPSDILHDAFLDCIIPKKGDGSYYKRNCRMLHAPENYRSDAKPTEHRAPPFLLEQSKQKPRGTGVFLPQRLIADFHNNKRTDKKNNRRRGNSKGVWEEKSKVQTSPCAVSSYQRQVFLPKEWTY